MKRAWLISLLGMFGCSGGAAKYPYYQEPDPRRAEYVIGVADDLEVSVWKNRELDSKISVRPDGNITMPLVGDVRADGLTPTELRGQISRRLLAFLREQEAVVTVAVTSVNSYYVTVSGNVMTPGRFASRGYLTIADAVALAGGPNRFAEPDGTILLRKSTDGSIRTIPIDYQGIIQGRSLEQNLVLVRGDTIYVP